MRPPDTLIVETRTHGRALLRKGEPPVAGLLAGFHGYAEHAGIQLERLCGVPGAAHWDVLAIQGLHRFYRGRGRETVAGWMTREDRDLAIADNLAYVGAVLDRADAGPGTLVMCGFSQGVAMAFRGAVRGRHRASAVVAVGGDVPPELLEDAGAVFPEILLVRGEADDWYTAESMARDAAALAGRGVTVQARTLPGGHEWMPAAAPVVGEFLTRIASRRPA